MSTQNGTFVGWLEFWFLMKKLGCQNFLQFLGQEHYKSHAKKDLMHVLGSVNDQKSFSTHIKRSYMNESYQEI